MTSYCCSGFKILYEEYGEVGFSLRIEDDLKNKSVSLIYRSVEDGDEVKINTPYKIRLESKIGIQFCPFCGVNLNKKLKKILR